MSKYVDLLTVLETIKRMNAMVQRAVSSKDYQTYWKADVTKVINLLEDLIDKVQERK